MEKMNKEKYVKKLVEATGKTENECIIINDILESHNIVGHNNKEKIKADFVAKLNITEEEADKLYNTCAELIVTGIFTRK